MPHFCYTCLSQDREVKPVDNFYTKPTLLEWFKDSSYRVNVNSFQLCWECFAMILKLNKFKRQVFRAQQIRLKVQKKKSARLVSQTKLCVYTKEMYDSEYVFEECDGEITKTKKKTLKRKKEKSCSKTKIKRKKAHGPDPEPTKTVPKIVNIYNFYNDPNVGTNIKKKETSNVSKAKDNKKRVEDVVDLTKDPKLTSMPVVLIDKKVKQELIDAYEAENKISAPVLVNVAEQNRPSVIMKVDDAEKLPENFSLGGSSIKFTIINLTKEQMLKTRELDRSERIYMKHFLKCELCVIGFAEETELDKHNEEKHSERIGDFKCPICATRFNNAFHLTQHEKTHYISYKCRQCDFENHRRYKIETHVVKEHNLTPSPVCAACDTEFSTQQGLNAHFERAHKERLKCNQCAQSFETVDRLRDHVTSHKENDEVVEIFKCAQCTGIFEGKAAYRAHMQCVHKDLAQQAYCAECDMQFDSLRKFKQHLREHSLFDQSKFDCTSGSSEDTLVGDMKRSHRMISHTCGLCKKGFSDAKRLKTHIQQKHPEVVTTEPAKDPSSQPLDVSVAAVVPMQPSRNKKCPICGEGFVTSTELLDHIRTHKAEKHFKCDVCDKSFATDMMLRKHFRTHATD